MITILADENIACLDEYFCHAGTTLIKLKGRDINQSAIDEYNPNALLIRSVTPIDANHISNTKNIKFIGSATIGTDHVDSKFLHKNNITFANASGCSKHSVAQYVITAILTIKPDYLIHRPAIGIIGLGNIGSTLAYYAKDLGWDILGYDPYLPKSEVNNSDFHTLLNNSDIISIHTPLTKHDSHATYQLFQQNTLNQLKDNALLINSARGEIINQADLLTAIDNKNLQVVLDVFPFEPTIDKHLLDKLTLATPHIAGYTLEGKLRGTDMIYQAFCQYFKLPITTKLDNLIPQNPYHWHVLKNELLKNNRQPLKDYYDISKDDANLRQRCTDKIIGTDFDTLRKQYALKREWLCLESYS